MIDTAACLPPARDQRLLPRLLAMLDSLQSDAEIVQAVRQVRRIVGPGAFAALSENVSLNHPERNISVRLRSLGLALNRLVLADAPETAQAIATTAAALINGTTVRQVDLLRTLSLLQVQPPEESLSRRYATDLDLRAAMEAVGELMRR